MKVTKQFNHGETQSGRSWKFSHRPNWSAQWVISDRMLYYISQCLLPTLQSERVSGALILNNPNDCSSW